jgi:hypothetical protein
MRDLAAELLLQVVGMVESSREGAQCSWLTTAWQQGMIEWMGQGLAVWPAVERLLE